MPNMVSVAEMAKRLKLDNTTVSRLIAKESENLQLEIHRGKGDKILLTEDDANKLIASYEARRGKVTDTNTENKKYDRYGFFTSFNWYLKFFPIESRLVLRIMLNRDFANIAQPHQQLCF